MANETRSQYHNEHHRERKPCAARVFRGDGVATTAVTFTEIGSGRIDREDHDPRIIENARGSRACGKPRGRRGLVIEVRARTPA